MDRERDQPDRSTGGPLKAGLAALVRLLAEWAVDDALAEQAKPQDQDKPRHE